MIATYIILLILTAQAPVFDVGMFLNTTAIRAIANVVSATLPTEIYVNKIIELNLTLEGKLYHVSVPYLTGTMVDLAHELTIFNTTNTLNTLKVGVTGYTTSVDVPYKVAVPLIKLDHNLTVTVTMMDILCEATLNKYDKGMRSQISFSNVNVKFGNLVIKTNVPYIDYFLESFEFLIVIEMKSRLEQLLGTAATTVNQILAKPGSENVIKVMADYWFEIQPVESPYVSSDGIIVAKLNASVLDAHTQKPVRRQTPPNPPDFHNGTYLTSQIYLSCATMHSALVIVTKFIKLGFNLTGNALTKFTSVIREMPFKYGDTAIYRLKMELAGNTDLKCDNGRYHLQSDINAELWQKPTVFDDETLVMNFTMKGTSILNLTLSNFLMFVMMDTMSVSNVVVTYSALTYNENATVVDGAMQSSVVEMVKYINGNFLSPFDIKTLDDTIDYGAKFLKGLSIRNDYADDYVWLGFYSEDL